MSITYRQGTPADARAVFQVFTESILDYGTRMNVMAITGGADELWARRGPLFEFLATMPGRFWVAEADNGEIAGYARAIEQDGMTELTEFFVRPPHQSGGLGRELLARAFAESDAPHRVIIATLDERALARYLKAGVYGRFPVKYFSRKAEVVHIPTDLISEPIDMAQHRTSLEHIDRSVLGHARGHLHTWIATTRDGFLYQRNGVMVGYGYDGGPFALLEEDDFPAVLAQMESHVAQTGGEFGVEVPFINKKALQYFMERNYRMDSFTALFMSNEPFGQFEKYLCFSPIFFF